MNKGLGNRSFFHCMGNCSLSRLFLVVPGMGDVMHGSGVRGGQSLVGDMALDIVNDLHDGYDLLFGIC